MFVLEWDNIKEQGLSLTWEQPATEFSFLAELEETQSFRFAEPVTASVEVRWIADLLEVSGNVKSSAEMACSRCLKEYKQDLRGYFSLTFTRDIPDIENLDGTEDDDLEIELTPEDLGLIHVPEDEIDLHDPVAEQLILALPVRPLCDDHCLGLCPGCGEDLNSKSCDCEKPVFNQKFAALKDLKIDKN